MNNRWYNSPVLGVILFILIVVGGCSYTAGECVKNGGEWDGNSLSCDR